jgi:predicted alpha/beta-hydrolase family hydrolase
MSHPFMNAIASGLDEVGIATLRYQFPYMENRSRRPDPPALCHATVAAAVTEAARVWTDLPLIAGGRSFGGRMTSQAQAKSPLPGVLGLAFLGFPLHPAKRPSAERAQHLFDIQLPLLFLQGTRDELAELSLLQRLGEQLGTNATLQLTEDANHSFQVPARTGRKSPEIITELVHALRDWSTLLITHNTAR